MASRRGHAWFCLREPTTKLYSTEINDAAFEFRTIENATDLSATLCEISRQAYSAWRINPSQLPCLCLWNTKIIENL